jgi:hypothetical protein
MNIQLYPLARRNADGLAERLACPLGLRIKSK